jgi:hypothetical protein
VALLEILILFTVGELFTDALENLSGVLQEASHVGPDEFL